MSLENAIQEQTAAIVANTTALAALLAIWSKQPAAVSPLTALIKDACAPLPKAKRVTPTTNAEGVRGWTVPAPITLTADQQAAVNTSRSSAATTAADMFDVVEVPKTQAPAAVEPVAAVVIPEVVALAAVSSVAAVIAYPEVMQAITACVIRDRAHAVATLAAFSAKRGTDLQVSDYPAFLAALGSAL